MASHSYRGSTMYRVQTFIIACSNWIYLRVCIWPRRHKEIMGRGASVEGMRFVLGVLGILAALMLIATPNGLGTASWLDMDIPHPVGVILPHTLLGFALLIGCFFSFYALYEYPTEVEKQRYTDDVHFHTARLHDIMTCCRAGDGICGAFWIAIGMFMLLHVAWSLLSIVAFGVFAFHTWLLCRSMRQYAIDLFRIKVIRMERDGKLSHTLAEQPIVLKY